MGADAYELSMVIRAIFNQRLEKVESGTNWNFEQIAMFESLINNKGGDAYGVFTDENSGKADNDRYKEEFTYESMEEDRGSKVGQV